MKSINMEIVGTLIIAFFTIWLIMIEVKVTPCHPRRLASLLFFIILDLRGSIKARLQELSQRKWL